MNTPRKTRLYVVVGFIGGLLLIGAKPTASQGSCQPVFDAMGKVFDVPSHSYVAMNLGGAIQTSEVIYAEGASYTKAGDKWSPGLIPLQELKAQAQENRLHNKTTCQYLRDESVNGETAALYSVHEETPKKGKTDSQVWISKAKGLLLRSEIDLGNKMLLSTRVEYNNVKPPK